MLAALTGRLRDSLQRLADRRDPSFLESVEHWRAIERDIHGTHDDEMGALISQAAFLLAVLATHARYRDGREAGECLSRSSFASLQSPLESDDPAFSPYLRIASHGLPVFVEDLESVPRPGPGVDIFSRLYQGMFPSSAKHASGEHYTPPELCALMLDRLAVTPGTRILDPTCGTGAFIVNAIAKARAATRSGGGTNIIENVHGRDLNPLAVLAARVNAWLQARDLGTTLDAFTSTIRVADALSSPSIVYDVVVGNPPWVTLKDYSSKERQVSILQQAKELHVAPDAHGVPQLELATVVFARCVRDLLAPGGVIFFVMTRSFIDGKHCSAFRSLDGTDGAEIWLFEGDQVFPKTFACLLCRRGERSGSYFLNQDTIPVRSWHAARVEPNGRSDARFEFKHVKDADFTPVNLRDARSSTGMRGGRDGFKDLGRLIPIQQVEGLLPTSPAPHYKAICYNGATVFPQSLLFVDIVDENVDGDPNLVRIAPAAGLKAKKPWNKRFYDSAVVERQYIFPLVKGSELHQFGIHEPFRVFLPLIRRASSYEFDAERFGNSHRTRASRHFQAIDEAYKRTCKSLDRIKDLWSRVNFDNELTNDSMAKPFKVIIPDCGSTMAAAIVSSDFIVEHALHYIGLDDEREAWYLLGVLNAPCIEKDVLIRKSERHIGQLALDYPIPPFDPASSTHASIETLARAISREVTEAIAAKHASTKLSRAAIKRVISTDSRIGHLISKLDHHVVNLLGGRGAGT
ncbi:MAG: N-6 DNA methylase [Candidatus Lokiarchaeota archaeon]|nr:N-6 DNA methylase [Candidatus Lokiarchaeota archaeon]